jgi:hypothetical protein
MSNVNQYVNVMRATGAKAAGSNPTSEFSQLKLELIEHYKFNKTKAEQLIKVVEASGDPQTTSPTHRIHYEAAVIAVRDYQPVSTVPPNKIGAPTDIFGAPKLANKESELINLQRAGWMPLK